MLYEHSRDALQFENEFNRFAVENGLKVRMSSGKIVRSDLDSPQTAIELIDAYKLFVGIQNNKLSKVVGPRVFQGLMEGLYLKADPEIKAMMRMYEFVETDGLSILEMFDKKNGEVATHTAELIAPTHTEWAEPASIGAPKRRRTIMRPWLCCLCSPRTRTCRSMTTFSLSARRATRNIPLAFFAGVLIALTEAILNPIILLVFFVGQLTDSLESLALVLAVSLLGWFVPQLVVPWLTGSASRRMPGRSAPRSYGPRRLSSLHTLGSRTTYRRRTAPVVFICFIAYSVASGFAQSPVNQLIARSLPSRIRRAACYSPAQSLGRPARDRAGLVARQALEAPPMSRSPATSR